MSVGFSLALVFTLVFFQSPAKGWGAADKAKTAREWQNIIEGYRERRRIDRQEKDGKKCKTRENEESTAVRTRMKPLEVRQLQCRKQLACLMMSILTVMMTPIMKSLHSVEVRTVLCSRCVCVTGVKCRVKMDMRLRWLQSSSAKEVIRLLRTVRTIHHTVCPSVVLQMSTWLIDMMLTGNPVSHFFLTPVGVQIWNVG